VVDLHAGKDLQSHPGQGSANARKGVQQQVQTPEGGAGVGQHRRLRFLCEDQSVVSKERAESRADGVAENKGALPIEAEIARAFPEGGPRDAVFDVSICLFLRFRDMHDPDEPPAGTIGGGLAEVRGARDHQDIPWAESLYQIQTLTNEILPALIEAAQAAGQK